MFYIMSAFGMYLTILCIHALCIYLRDNWEKPSATNMLAENVEVLTSRLGYH